MDVFYFTEMPYAEFPESEAEKFPSMRLTFPNTYFDPQTASGLMNRYLDEYQHAEEMGFDGLMLNEHHNTPSCMDVEVNITGGILARITKRAKILMLGNMLPTSDNPVRLAEEIALLDVISGGRIISGFVRGIGIESWANNTNPIHNRERFEECHDLVVKTWTTPGPFRWEGNHYHYRAVNPWMLPIQKPHPPVWVPGTGSPETVEWTARHRYTYAAFLTPLEVAKNLFARYREYAAADGWEPGPEKFAFMICAHVNDTDEKAQEAGKAFLWRMNYPLRGPREYWSPPGYTSRARRRCGGRPASHAVERDVIPGAAGPLPPGGGQSRHGHQEAAPHPRRAGHRLHPAGGAGRAAFACGHDAVDRAVWERGYTGAEGVMGGRWRLSVLRLTIDRIRGGPALLPETIPTDHTWLRDRSPSNLAAAVHQL